MLPSYFLDNGVSSEVSLAPRTGYKPPGDRLSTLEGKLARMEGRKTEQKVDRDNNKRMVAYLNGKEVCFFYNSREGCKRQPIPGGCRAERKEYAHACNIWVKTKMAYCLLPHSRRDHK